MKNFQLYPLIAVLFLAVGCNSSPQVEEDAKEEVEPVEKKEVAAEKEESVAVKPTTLAEKPAVDGEENVTPVQPEIATSKVDSIAPQLTGKLVKLVNEEPVDFELGDKHDYYVFYHSASW